MPSTLPDHPSITVVTRQQWRAGELSQAADVRSDMGLDVSAGEDLGKTLWCPGAWAAAAVSRFPDRRFSSAGPDWLDRADKALTGRDVVTTSAGELLSGSRGVLKMLGPMFSKLPETKHERFPAEVRSPEQLITDVDKLPADEPVQLQGRVHLSYEVRCWVLDGEVVAHASYFADAGRERWPEMTRPWMQADAAEWLQRSLADLPELPPAVVVDVGWCVKHVPGGKFQDWRVIEANAAWSSDWYEPSDLPAVIATIVASQGPDVDDRWLWRPSPLLQHAAVGLARR